jgi:hypothetical protein
MPDTWATVISFATRAASLNRRTFHTAVGTEDAAVTWLWLEQSLAGPTLVEPLAGVRGHGFSFFVPTGGTGDL